MYISVWNKTIAPASTSDGRNQDFRSRPRLLFWVSWYRDRDRDFYFGSRWVETETETFILGHTESRPRRDFHFGSRGIETETETFISGLVESRPRPKLLFWVSLNRDRDRDRDWDFYFESHEIDTEIETFILVSCKQRQSQKHPEFVRAQTNKCFNPKEQEYQSRKDKWKLTKS